MLILLAISMLGFMLFVANKMSWSLESAAFFVFPSITALLYFFALGKNLVLGTYILFVSGILLFIFFLLVELKSGKKSIADFCTPGVVLFSLFSLVIWLLYKNAAYSSIDEFSHWGFIVKEMINVNGLAGTDSALIYKDYPPGTALFIYYVAKIVGYSEGITYFAQDIFLLAPAILFLSGVKWRESASAVLMFAVGTGLVITFGHGLNSLYVDHVVGVYFGMALFSYFELQEKPCEAILKILPTLFILPLIKSLALIFSLVIILIICTDLIIRYIFPLSRRNFVFSHFSNSKKTIANFILIAFLVSTPVLSTLSWKYRLETLHIQESKATQDLGFSLNKIKRSFSKENSSSRDKVTINEFLKALKYKNIGQNKYITAFSSLLLIFTIIVLLYIIQTNSTRRKQIIYCNLLLGIGFSLYAFALLYYYLYKFSEYEGTHIASFDRYIAIYFLGWSLILFTWITNAFRSKKIIKGLFVIVLIGLISSTPLGIFKQSLFPPSLSKKRQNISQMVSQVRGNILPRSKVYIIWQNSQGYEFEIVKYEISPFVSNTWDWSLGEPYNSKDIWTTNLSVEKLAQVLSEYDYVIVGSADKAFWDKYGRLFSPSNKNQVLFKVSKEVNGSVRLLKI